MLKIAFDKIYKHPLDENHRFPMIKYDLIPEQLLRENTCNHENFFKPSSLNDSDVLLTHDEDYYNRFSSLLLTKKEIRPIGFPMSKELVIREKKISQGTIECVDFSIKNGISMNIAGGTHHAFKDRGEAFCMLNDQAIAANYLIKNNKAKVIDDKNILYLKIVNQNTSSTITTSLLNLFHSKKRSSSTRKSRGGKNSTKKNKNQSDKYNRNTK